jgi:hypothetical protein
MQKYTLNKLLEDNTPPPEQIIGGGILLYKSMLLIAGAPKAKKTMLVTNLALALTAGKSFSIFEIKEKHKVLVLSAEGGYYPNRDRIKKMSNAIEIQHTENAQFIFDSRLKLENEDDYSALKQMIEENKPDVLVVDPYVKFHNKDENSAQEMGYVLEKLRNIIEDYNLSIILVHHLGKSSQQGARGSSAIMGEYDSCITLNKPESGSKHKLEFDLRHSNNPSNNLIVFNKETLWFETLISPLVKLIQDYGPMEKKDLVGVMVESKLYKAESGAYKAIDKEVEAGTIFCDENNLYQIQEVKPN